MANFYIMVDKYLIKPKKVIKILGMYVRYDLKMDNHFGQLIGQLHNRVYEIKCLTTVTDQKTRLSFMNAVDFTRRPLIAMQSAWCSC